jgi:hypothetical protein
MADSEPEFDCAGKAEREGQPKPFVLIASDPLAPWLIEQWEAMSRGDIAGALGAFYGMVDTCSLRYTSEPRSQAKLDSAATIAMDMRNWRIERGLK